MTTLERRKPSATALATKDLVTSARSYAEASKASRTKAIYRAAWSTFVAWCDEQGLTSLPATPTTVALYLTARADAGKKVATLAIDLVAISQAHKAAGLPSPRGAAEVHAVMRGIRRTKLVAQTKKAPVLVGDLRKMVRVLPGGLLGLRDRALLLLGFAAALRRSELVGLDVQDVAFVEDGLELVLRRSKTDQEGQGEKLGVPYGSDPVTCPVRAVRAWVAASGLTEGPLLRSVNRHGRVSSARLTSHAVALVVKRSAAAAGLDSTRVSGHSLRAGLVTSAAKAGKQERVIARQTRHRSMVVLRGYIRDADLFSENAASGIGL